MYHGLDYLFEWAPCVNKDEKETFSRKSYGKSTVCVN